MTEHTATPPRLQARVWEERGRICLTFDFSEGPVDHPSWVALIADLKATFVRPRRASWRPARRCWSMRASERAHLLEWCDTWGLDIHEERDERLLGRDIRPGALAHARLLAALLQRWGVAESADGTDPRTPDGALRDWYGEHTPLGEREMAEIAARAAAATPGPWHWTDDLANAYLTVQHRRKKRERYLYLLQGRPNGPSMELCDQRVMALMWRELRQNDYAGSPSPADRAFMAAARADVPRLLAEIRRLRGEVARLRAGSPGTDAATEDAGAPEEES